MTAAAGLLLAAGAGRRLGMPKALVELDGRLLVERGIDLLGDAGCQPLVVVLGAASEEVQRRADLSRAVAVVNTRWQHGLSTSLRAGLRALEESGAGAAVIALVDQPLVRPEAVRRLIAAWRRGAVAAVATYGGEPRNPVLIARSAWHDAATEAVGDAGARAFLNAHRHSVAGVACDDVASEVDIDTPGDLARAEAEALAFSSSPPSAIRARGRSPSR